MLYRILLHRRNHLVIKHQLVNQCLLAGELKRPDFDIESSIDFVDHPIDATPQVPAKSG